ncbi:hypothetical protein N2152v2_009722 [Parachlorella kessleri]
MRLQALLTSWGGSRYVRVPQPRASSQGWKGYRRSSFRPSLAAASAGGSAEQPTAPQPLGSPQQQQPVQQASCGAWEQACQQVAAFQRQHGRLPRASADEQGVLLPGEHPLGVWCTEQQRRKAGSKGPPLSAQERAAVLAIEGWSWWATKRVIKPWQRCYFVPGEQALGGWINAQRKHFRGQQQPPLSPELIAALERTPGWSWGEYVVEPWEVRFQQVQDFVQQHGRLPRRTARSNSPFLPAEKELGVWVHSQRQKFKDQKLSAEQRQRGKGSTNRSSALTAEQQAALAAVPGWYWDEDDRWEQQRQQLEAFVWQHGRMPRKEPTRQEALLTGEKKLSIWYKCQRQRQKGTSGFPALTAKQLAALEAIPLWCSQEGP